MRIAPLVLAGALGALAAAAQPPSILLIVSDDQGYADLGCFGSKEAKTPNLDRLAAGGARLTSFYVAWPACTPSRGALLTGRYPQRNGMYDMVRNEAPDYGYRYSAEEYAVSFEHIGGMDTREVLLPQLLKPAGYATGLFGKWDLGRLRRFLPLQRGFDEFYGFANTGIDYFTHERYGVPSMFRGNDPTVADRGTYCTTLFHREAASFIERHKDAPFFCMVPYNAPHNASNLDPRIRGAAQAPDEFKRLYPELLAHDAEFVARKDKHTGAESSAPGPKKRRLEYLAALSCMDDSIGRLLDLLESHKIAERTIVIFFSDNGGSGGSENTPLRGGKSSLWEGGVRVPCLIRWPGVIPPGTTSAAFVTAMDLFPTLLAASGAARPRDLVLDGHDMREALAGRASSPRTEMFWQRQGDRAARVGQWKWVDAGKHGGLFNLDNDLAEARDLSKSEPDALARVKSRFDEWRRTMDAAEPRGPFRDF